jgi:hypothetical protein
MLAAICIKTEAREPVGNGKEKKAVVKALNKKKEDCLN